MLHIIYYILYITCYVPYKVETLSPGADNWVLNGFCISLLGHPWLVLVCARWAWSRIHIRKFTKTWLENSQK